MKPASKLTEQDIAESVANVANYLEIALPIAQRIRTEEQHHSKTAAFRFITLLVGGNLYRTMRIDEGADRGCYIHRLPKINGHPKSRQTSYHSDPIRGYQVHHYGVSGKLIRESRRKSSKFITDYHKHFFQYHLPGEFVEGDLIETVTDRDIVFNLDQRLFDGYTIRLYSDFRMDLFDTPPPSTEVRVVELRTYHLIITLTYEKYQGMVLGHKVPLKSRPEK